MSPRYQRPWSRRSSVPLATRTVPKKFAQLFFDPGYYLRVYPDVGRSAQDPFDHFMEHGRSAGRYPSAGWRLIEGAVELRSLASPSPVADIVSLFPRPKHRSLMRSVYWKRLQVMMHPELYAAQSGAPAALDVSEAFDDYLAHGAFDGRRPSALFHPAWYLEQLDRASLARPGADVHPFFHWLTAGWKHRIVPTPLYDEDFYLALHPRLAQQHPQEWHFLHFVKSGCYEAGVRPSSVVARPKPAGPKPQQRQAPLLLGQLLASAADEPGQLRRSSPLEDAAVLLARKLQRLHSPEMRELVEKAAAIEPLVMRPYGPREATLLPVKHAQVNVRNAGEAVRRALPATHFDTVVLAPHCRMAGSARVTGALTHAMDSVAPEASVLLLTTDLSDFERPDWFSARVVVFDLSAHLAGLVPDDKVRVLLDAVRGLTPTRVINVNSRLGWDLFKLYGRQLSAITELGSYLFTWDLDDRGNKGGYPITYFQDCFATLSWVLLDNDALRRELIDRYALSSTLQRKLLVAYTPVDETAVDHSSVFERRRAEGRPLRTFWAGRFDRQKRFDVVVELAKALPDLEICAWGKQVLGGLDIDFDALPANIKLEGTFRHFDDLPLESYDFFLYTSEWDGLPTILLDAGARGVATVASKVGGVPEVLSDTTGYPVVDALDAKGYLAAIEQMVADPAEVTRRAKALKAQVQGMFATSSYAEAVRLALRLGAPPPDEAPEVEHIDVSLGVSGG